MANCRTFSDQDADSQCRYSDDFVSDESRTPTPTGKDRLRGRGRGSGGAMRGRGRGRGARRGRGYSRNSEPADVRRSHDTITQRVISASRNRVNEMRNKVEELKIQIRDLQQENRLYKRMQFRQEKALRGFDDKENDLPNILEKHNNETRSLKELNRKMREKYEKSDRYLRDAEDELERVKNKLKKYRAMADDKDLLKREELSKKVTKAEIDLEERDIKIKELERHIDMLKKNHRHELGIEVARQKEMKRQVDELENKNTNIATQLKEKEKELEYKNIYSNRPAVDNSEDGTPGRKSKKKTSSMTDFTPRDKAKFYAEKRRVELRKQKELKSEQEKKKREQWENEEKERELNAAPSTPPAFSFNSIDRDLEERQIEDTKRKEEEEMRWSEREGEEKEHSKELERRRRDLERRQEENSWRENEDREKRERELRMKRDLEREENDRKEREGKERREREEKERLEREERERKERIEAERQEREKAEQDRRLQLERKKLDNDPAILDERRKKDELLKKLHAMDELGSAGTKRDVINTSPQHRRVKENSHGGSSGNGFDSPSRRSERKEYSFTKPINNMHQGKPSHDDVGVPYIDKQRISRRSISKDDDLGYQPSFVPTKTGMSKATVTTTKPVSIFDNDEPAFKPAGIVSTGKNNIFPGKDKKTSKLLENLFGPQAVSTKEDPRDKSAEETLFMTSKSPQLNNNKKSNNSVTVLPWDTTTTSSSKTNGNLSGQGGSTIYGGGAALLDDDDFTSDKNRVLHRRQKQNNFNTFASKPTVTAMDAFDDDFEEVVL